METNEFARMNQMVSSIVQQYRDVRRVCGISDKDWHSRSIERMARPFIKGCFTLAVVGKVSSGKSTFINALLGCKELLPTGHDQTTSGITTIEYGEIPEVIIKFGDNHEETIKGNDIVGKIKPHVSISEKYHDLPVNNIDSLILENWNFERVWGIHEQLEKETLCSSIDKNLLRDYVSTRSSNKIAVDVRMKYPFNEELKGWKIIDTPGIGAIGGIEGKTKQLLNLQKEDGTREVDAIIFLQDGSQTLDQTDTKKFVLEQLENFSEEDKRRLFFVLTHSSSVEFLSHKNEKLNTVQKSYGDKIHTLTYADGLLYTFINDLEDSDVDLTQYQNFEKPEDWEEDQWDEILNVLFQATRDLKKSNETINNETLFRKINEWANFVSLKKEINTFARNEKKNSLSDLVKLVSKDYLGFVKQLENDINIVGDLNEINRKISEVESSKREYNQIAKKADEQIRIYNIINNFDFIDSEINTFSRNDSIGKVRTAITNLFDRVQKEEKNIFKNLIKNYSDFFKNVDSKNIVLESIDYAQLERQATDNSKETYMISPRRVEKHVSRRNEVIEARYGTRINEKEKIRNFIALAVKKARQQRDDFFRQLKDKVEAMNTAVQNEIYNKIMSEKEHLESLKREEGRIEQIKAEKKYAISQTRDASEKLNKLFKDYEQ